VWVYTSEPWKQPIYYNVILTVWLVAIITINSVLFFFTQSLTPFFEITELPLTFEAIIFGITYLTLLCGLFWRLFVNALRLYES